LVTISFFLVRETKQKFRKRALIIGVQIWTSKQAAVFNNTKYKARHNHTKHNYRSSTTKKKIEIFSGWDENNGNSKIVLFKYEKTTLVKTLSLVIIVTKASGWGERENPFFASLPTMNQIKWKNKENGNVKDWGKN